MKMKRILWGFLMIAAVAFLAGCGGGGGGNNSRIMELEDMLAAVTTERDTAQASVTDLMGMLTMSGAGRRDAIDRRTRNGSGERPNVGGRGHAIDRRRLSTAQADVTRLTGELAAANLKLVDFEDEIAAAKAREASIMAKGFLASMITQSVNMDVDTIKATRTADGVTVLIDANDQDQSDYGPSDHPVAPAITGWHGAALEAKGRQQLVPGRSGLYGRSRTLAQILAGG